MTSSRLADELAEFMVAEAKQAAEVRRLTEALQVIASLPDQTEQWSRDDVAVRIAQAALEGRRA